MAQTQEGWGARTRGEQMPFDYEGKVAVVTGAASGIGLAAAHAFAARGADVVLADVDDVGLGEAEAAVGVHGHQVLAMRCDVAQDDDVERLAADTIQRLGRADVVMNNAGVAIRGHFTDITMDDWSWIIGINLLGVVRGCRAFVPHLVERGSGWIVNTASIGGLAASTVGTPYITTKQAVVGLSESLSLLLRPQGIGVSVLCPGGVATNIWGSMRKVGDDPAVWGPQGGGDASLLQTSEQVAEIMLAGIDEDRFLIPTFPVAGAIGQRIEGIEALAKRKART
jgi:NAD(P)-dependent dehydrogenase (short-subunit alcohol dehydrogenase family)